MTDHRGDAARLMAAIALVVAVGVVLAVLVSFGGRDDQLAAASPSASSASASTSPSAALASPPSDAPTDPPSPGLIAVVDDSGALSTMDADGGSRVLYPMPGVVLGFPAWSPDDSRIAVTGQGADGTAIYVFTVGRDELPTVIYRSPDRPPFYLYWTPDGRSVSFLVTEPSSISLRIAPADGSAPLDGNGPGSIVREGAPLYFDWVDADRLLLHVGFGADAFAGEVGSDGTPTGQPLPGTGNFRSASVSPDGGYLAYVRSETDSTGQLVVAARDGSGSHELPVSGPAAFVFGPTGDSLAMIAADKPVDATVGFPVGPLRIIDSANGAVRTLLEGPIVAFFWSPDARTIATLQPILPGDDDVANAGVALASAIEPGPPPAVGAQAPGVGARLTFVDVSTGGIHSERVVLLAERFVNGLLPYFDQYALSHRLWAPDSASLVMPLVSATGRNQLVVVPADGSDPTAIADGDMGSWSP